MPERYVAARHGAAPDYPHPDLEPVLTDTYGVTIWHEQIMGMISVLTGTDLAPADVARRTLGDRDRLPALRAWFHERAAARGYDHPDVRDQMWRTIENFGSYGFCRAHAVAFAVPALQSAWLKAHHPAALYAGLLEHDPGMWPRRVIVADARRHRVPILPVDVNHSRPGHTVEQTDDGTWGVRLALSAVRGITDEECGRIAAGRPYTSLTDLWQRARPALPTAEHLARIGALDCLHDGRLTRRDLLLQLPELHRRTRTVGDRQPPLDATQPSGLPEMTVRESVGAELHVLGIDVTRHLMEHHHHRLLRELGATDIHHLTLGRRSGQMLPPGRDCKTNGGT